MLPMQNTNHALSGHSVHFWDQDRDQDVVAYKHWLKQVYPFISRAKTSQSPQISPCINADKFPRWVSISHGWLIIEIMCGIRDIT